MKTLKLEITENDFFDWYFGSGSDAEMKDNQQTLLGSVLHSLKVDASASITLLEIFETCNQSLIPLDIVFPFNAVELTTDLTLEDIQTDYDLQLVY